MAPKAAAASSKGRQAKAKAKASVKKDATQKKTTVVAKAKAKVCTYVNKKKAVTASTEKEALPQQNSSKATLQGEELKQAEAFMGAAACSALAGVRIQHGGPFGAAVVRDGVVVSCAHNMVLCMGCPTRHAEMNAISQACQALGTHDLSDCDLYTTCEPCPMCWGAVQWSRLPRVHIGVDRHTAAKYGFDDKVFYDEVDAKAGCYGLKRYGYIADTNAGEKKLKKQAQRAQKNMVEVFDGICHREVAELFADPNHNRTLRRRFAPHEVGIGRTISGEQLAEDCKPVRHYSNEALDEKDFQLKQHEDFMKLAVKTAERGVKMGRSKEREPFGAIIVKDGTVIAEAHNTVLDSRDATATAEVNAIRQAAVRLGTHNLEGCYLYATAHPDLMSLGAILWARISRVYCAVTQQLAAQCGFEEGMLHFKDLLEVQDGHPRITTVIDNVAKPECEAVFKEWSDRNGVIY